MPYLDTYTFPTNDIIGHAALKNVAVEWDTYHLAKTGVESVWIPLQEDADEITMTLVVRVQDRAGRFLGVTGADLRVEDTIDVKLAAAVGTSHKAFIVEDDGTNYTMVGASEPGVTFGRIRIPCDFSETTRW